MLFSVTFSNVMDDCNKLYRERNIFIFIKFENSRYFNSQTRVFFRIRIFPFEYALTEKNSPPSQYAVFNNFIVFRAVTAQHSRVNGFVTENWTHVSRFYTIILSFYVYFESLKTCISNKTPYPG